MKRGFFGGTFDPIHFGHINLAFELSEAHGLDEVLFCPAARSPFKQGQTPGASAEHRLAMVKRALEEVPYCRVCPLEVEQGGVSYTVDTLRKLKGPLFLLLSSDAVESFHLWKDPAAIVELAPPLVGVRGGWVEIPPSPVKEALEKGITTTAQLDISSTAIRQRLKKRLYCGHLLPKKVLEYIEEHHLYC